MISHHIDNNLFPWNKKSEVTQKVLQNFPNLIKTLRHNNINGVYIDDSSLLFSFYIGVFTSWSESTMQLNSYQLNDWQSIIINMDKNKSFNVDNREQFGDYVTTLTNWFFDYFEKSLCLGNNNNSFFALEYPQYDQSNNNYINDKAFPVSQDLENSDIKNYNNLKQDYAQIVEESPVEMDKCSICLEDFNMLDPMCFIFNCNCILHNPCFNQYVISCAKNYKFPILCPKCNKSQIDEATIHNILVQESQELEEKYIKYTWSVYQMQHNSDELCCPTPGCDYFFFYGEGHAYFQCEKCKKEYCLRCRVDWHQNDNCNEFRRKKALKSDIEEFNNLAISKKMKQCPFCKFFVEKSEGCNHMTCRCKNEFCYKCGQAYVKKKKQCKCN